MGNRRSTSFIVELMILFVILIVVIVTIITLNMKTRDQSIRAGRLNDAVVCAENAAEITAGAENAEQTGSMLRIMDGAGKAHVEKNRVTASVDLPGRNEGKEMEKLLVMIDVKTGKKTRGTFVKKKIKIYDAADDELVFTLDTGNYVRRDQK